MCKKGLSKRKIEVALFVVIWAFTLLSLAFPFLTKSQPSFGKEHTFSGFSMMKWFRDVEPHTSFDDWLIIFTYLVILVCLVEAIVYGVSCWKKSEKLIGRERIFVILNLLLVFVYMVNGYNAWRYWDGESVTLNASTEAYIPFIIVSLLTIAYFTACKKEFSRRKTEGMLFIVIWVFTLLSLAFPFLIKTWKSGSETSYNGFNMMVGQEYSPGTGFDLWLVRFSYIVILACLVEAIIYGVLCWKKSEKRVCVERIFVILNLVLVFVYILNGIQACWAWNGDIVDITPSTSAHIPFIIVSILTAVYFILPRYIEKRIAKKEE